MADIKFDNIKLQFEKFLSLVGNVLVHEKEMNIIQNKLRRHFNRTSSSYLCSTDFQLLLDQIHYLFIENIKSTKYFELLASFDEQLKKHSIKLSGSNRSSNEVSSSTHNTEVTKITSSTNEKSLTTSSESLLFTINDRNISTLQDAQVFHSSNHLLFEQIPIPDKDSTDSTHTSTYELKQAKKIRKLERRLSSLSKTIRELEERELSLDEMEYSDLYVVESNLKKQAYEMYKRLAELKNESPSAERILYQPVTLSEIDICDPLINHALEDMVNQGKCLPSFDEVLNTVEKTNQKYKLHLSADNRKNLAEKSFKIIGRKIKNRRMADFNDIMNSRLAEDFDIEQDDPACNSNEIEKVLLENEREAVSKTEKIFEEFSQIDPDTQPEVNIDSSEESTIESDDEENGEEEEEEEEEEVRDEPSDNNSNETHYDIVDILPPFSPKSSTPSPTVVTETENQEDHVDTTVEFSFNDRTLSILSTASIPIKRTTYDSFTSTIRSNEPEVFNLLDEKYTQESQPIAVIQEHRVQTIIPRRRRHHTSSNKTLYDFYKRITHAGSSVAERRTLSKDVESSKSKKYKKEPEMIVLD